MTYFEFLLLFLALPLALLVFLLRRQLVDWRFLAYAGTLTLVALVYMAVWDHLAAVWGLWTWNAAQTWGPRWWAIPPEEYLFCILEVLLAVTLMYALFTWRSASATRVEQGKREKNEGQR